MEQHAVKTLRIVLYPSHMHSRTAVHVLATALGAFLAVRMTLGLPWWNGLLWYVCSFVGVHIVMVPVMTAWHAALAYARRSVRAIVEEELIRFDLHNYERQLARVIARPTSPPDS